LLFPILRNRTPSDSIPLPVQSSNSSFCPKLLIPQPFYNFPRGTMISQPSDRINSLYLIQFP
jgi:hypothetical protein